MSKERLSIFLIAVFALIMIAPASSYGADKTKEETELNELIGIVNSKQATPQKIKIFKERLKSYFFEVVKFDVIERLLKELPPGKALTVIAFTSLSKKSDREIVGLMNEGKNWTEIAQKTGVKLKDVLEKIRHYRLMSGCG